MNDIQISTGNESTGATQNGSAQTALRGLPSIERMLAHPDLQRVREALPLSIVTDAVRKAVEEARASILAGGEDLPSSESIAAAASAAAWQAIMPSLRPVINATGVIIHTNLGRAPLSTAAVDAIREAAGYSNLEYDLVAGGRGSRYTHAIRILRQVVGCEDALVVNNNAAALVLVLSALCSGREAILSRSQSVEIGGGFRIPEIMKTSGAHLVEVGTTNRTYAHDYANAVTEKSALVMRVHSSNFRIVGFTASATVQEMAEVAHSHGLLFVDDIGSGALLDTSRYGIQAEPRPQESLAAGADLVMFSGDKLLGGPQCGIIVGKSDIVARLKKHPLTRALRVDKFTLAALEATLLHYLKNEAEREVPVWRMLSAQPDEMQRKVQQWASTLSEAGIQAEVVPGQSTIGGGSLPGETLPTYLLSINQGEAEAGRSADKLRAQSTPVIARVDRGSLLLDPRTVLPAQEQALLDALKSALQN